MWLLSCSRQGILTQGPAQDTKCELNITSFLTFPDPLHCPICAKDILVTVLLLQVMGGWVGWGVVHYFFYFLFCFCAVFAVSWPVDDIILISNKCYHRIYFCS